MVTLKRIIRGFRLYWASNNNTILVKDFEDEILNNQIYQFQFNPKPIFKSEDNYWRERCADEYPELY